MSDGLRVMTTCACVLSLAVIAAPASAGQGWVQFADAILQRLLADNAVGAGDVEEKDYAWGDLDRDGDIDLVCVRKQPFDTTGARRSVLFMNEGVRDGHVIDGVLVDRTALLASASDAAGDMGLLTPTNSRDVKLYTFMIHNPVVTGACGPGIICIWDVNFDCIVNGDDMDAVLDHIAQCQTEPRLCEGGESFGGGEGGLSAERFAIALAGCDPALTDEQMAVAWEHFFAALN